MIKEYRWLESEMEKIPDPDPEGPLPESVVPLYHQSESLDGWINHLVRYYKFNSVYKAIIADLNGEVKTEQRPTTDEFQDILCHYADEEACFGFAAEFHWPNGVECPYCECQRLSFISTRKVWHCKECKKRFSVKTGTIMEDSNIPLTKWIPAYCIFDETNGTISSCELARVLGVCQKTAWLMIQRIKRSYPSIMRRN